MAEITCTKCGATSDDIESRAGSIEEESLILQFHCGNCGNRWEKRYVEEF